MLTWPAGPRQSDGVWAPHWYEQVLRSTGFERHRPRNLPVPPEYEPILAAVLPSFEELAVRRLR